MKATITKIILLFTTFFLVSACCNEENIYITPEDTEGRVNVYIEGDITNAEAAEQLKNEVGTLTQNIYVQHTTQLTEIDIKIVKDLKYILIDNNNSLKKTTIEGGGETFVNVIKIEKNNSLTEVFIEKIKNTNFIIYKGTDKQQTEKLICNDLENIYVSLDFSTHINNNNILQFNHLKTIGTRADNYIIENNWQYNETYIGGKFNMVVFPKLEEVNYFNTSSYNADTIGDTPMIIDTLRFPQLKSIETFKSEPFFTVNTLNLPKLEYCKNFYIRGVGNDYISPGTYENPTINFPVLSYCENFTMMFNHSSAEKINNYLHQFLTIQPINSKILYFEQESFPTGQGVLDQQTLINQGNTIEFY